MLLTDIYEADETLIGKTNDRVDLTKKKLVFTVSSASGANFVFYFCFSRLYDTSTRRREKKFINFSIAFNNSPFMATNSREMQLQPSTETFIPLSE